jgi:hypothetical protein
VRSFGDYQFNLLDFISAHTRVQHEVIISLVSSVPTKKLSSTTLTASLSDIAVVNFGLVANTESNAPCVVGYTI